MKTHWSVLPCCSGSKALPGDFQEAVMAGSLGCSPPPPRRPGGAMPSQGAAQPLRAGAQRLLLVSGYLMLIRS